MFNSTLTPRRFRLLALALTAAACAVPAVSPAKSEAATGCYATAYGNSPSGMSWIYMSNMSWNLVRTGGWASIRTCSGHAYVNWSPSLADNRGDLSFLGAYMQFRTNRGRVFTSTRQYVLSNGWVVPRGGESHYDLAFAEYPVQVKYVFLARKNANAGTAIGSYNRTCWIRYSPGTSSCGSGQGAGRW